MQRPAAEKEQADYTHLIQPRRDLHIPWLHKVFLRRPSIHPRRVPVMEQRKDSTPSHLSEPMSFIRVTYKSMDYLIWIEENDSTSTDNGLQILRVGPCEPPSPILCRYPEGNHSCQQLKRAMATSYPEESIQPHFLFGDQIHHSCTPCLESFHRRQARGTLTPAANSFCSTMVPSLG